MERIGYLMSYSLFIFAGEPSGDLLGESLIKELYLLDDSLEIFGVGGPKMRTLRFHPIAQMEQFQVMGFIDVIFALPRLYKLFYKIAGAILTRNPEAAILIDYPGFTLRLESYLRKKGFQGKLIHYVSPSVWAHGASRIQTMEKNLDLLLTLFPFESQFFSKLPVKYVGHPLVYTLKHLPPITRDPKLIALLPGSRSHEIKRNFPMQIEAVKPLLKTGFKAHVSVAHPQLKPLLYSLMKKQEVLLPLIDQESSYELMQTCSLACAKCGTVTLELALFGTPTVVLYKTSYLDYLIVKYILKIDMPFYSLPNIISQKEVFPELMGPYVTSSFLEKKMKELLLPSYQKSQKKSCKNLLSQFGDHLPSKEAGIAIFNLLTNPL